MIDAESEIGRQALRRLGADSVIWLTTVDGGGTPQPRPIWFLWDDGTILTYSKPDTAKLKHIANRPRVSLNFNSDEYGGDVVVILGEARLEPDAPPVNEVAAYMAKYSRQLPNLGFTPETFAAEYSATIRVQPTRVRGIS